MSARPRLRLEKLEVLVPRGCPTCCCWQDVVLTDDHGWIQRPERCPGCGRLVPIVSTVHVVGIDLDWL